ncbi:hypothetical protein SPSYN_01660 [Sporotomaculum syntrophicum]|uniref:Uncharacterized protein n=1 Tax=Sporotomaculum syntrophicum TaxID=182264 RepID=A0A9D2WQ12_9FIRM|nr:hypothetical protein [Sporotomaculum syntrophicum]KAF1085517.1 hypothetical protein SPSYN_01660 [Sporotomaculum syntrophicum]
MAGVEHAFLEVIKLGLTGAEAAEKLLEIVGRRNFIPETAERQYKYALILAYRHTSMQMLNKSSAWRF